LIVREHFDKPAQTTRGRLFEELLAMPKVSSSRAAAAARRHNPLAEDITSAGHLRTQSSKKGKSKANENDEDAEDGQRYIDAKMSRKILQIGQELADEDAAEQLKNAAQPKSNGAFEFDTRFEDEAEPFSDDEGKFEADDWVDDEVEQVVRIFNQWMMGLLLTSL
jgi:essential nuclear protein 1